MMDHEQQTDGEAMATKSVVTATTSTDFQHDLDRITSLRDLPENWDTYGGVPPTRDAAARASVLLYELAGAFRNEPYATVRPHGIAPLVSGGVNLEWRGPNGEMTIEIYPDGRLGLFVEATEDGETVERDEEDPSMATFYTSVSRIPANDAHARIRGESSRAIRSKLARASTILVMPER